MSFWSWPRRVAVWLVRDTRLVWITIAVLVLPFAFWSLVFDDLEHRLRLTGMILELLGLVTVAIGLSETRRQFGRPSLLETAKSVLGRFPRIKRRPTVLGGGGVTSGEAKVRGYVHTSYQPSPNTPLPDQVNVLVRRLNEAGQSIVENATRIDDETESREAADAEERRLREAADQGIRKTVEDFAVGGLSIEMMGLVWLAVGIVLAGASCDLQRWITGNLNC